MELVTPDHAEPCRAPWNASRSLLMRLPAALRSMSLWLVLLVPLILANGTLSGAVSTQSQPPHPLNDTGIDWCADGDSNNLSCPVVSYPTQDGDYGRDVIHNDDSDGHAGFSFTKLDANGQDLPVTATAWSCVRDNITGLVWEVKTDDGGLRDKDQTYSWLDKDIYSLAVNADGLCGFSDWRTPAIEELIGIAHLGRTDPAIDTNFFPNTTSSFYWSTYQHRDDDEGDYAWSLNFQDGNDAFFSKSYRYRIRLVRGTRISRASIDNGDGTVIDAATGLMWAKCSAGQSGANCSGRAYRMTWHGAFDHAEHATLAGYSDWRLPNRKELRSFYSYAERCGYWSSSPYAGDSNMAWFFGCNYDREDGQYVFDGYDSKTQAAEVRLVRDAQWLGRYDLLISVEGDGTVTSVPSGINCGQDCYEMGYAPGAEVILTAAPALGSELTAWSESSCGTASTCTVTIDQAKAITVIFERRTYPIQIVASPSYGGTVGCSPNPVEYGGNATCTATPASGYVLDSWGGDCGSTETATCTFPGLIASAEVVANFVVDDTIPPPIPLNDTGLDWCSHYYTNFLDCPVMGYIGQDGDYGRDSTHDDDRDGHAGFSFTKLDADGQDLTASATAWNCVRDNVTGLIWEVKADDAQDLRDRDWQYSWYDSGSADDLPGTEDGGNCLTNGRCDTEKYVEDVNAQRLCGYSDWRMPTLNELAGVIDYGLDAEPSIDSHYFPNTKPSWYWSSSSYADNLERAWALKFDAGDNGYPEKASANRVRLVRGEQASSPFVNHGNGTVTDMKTGLMWGQCSAGQSGASCSGTVVSMTWEAALAYAEYTTLAGYSDWRLPNLKELNSLIDTGSHRPSIDGEAFPATRASRYWSSSPTASHPDYPWYAWSVSFDLGDFDQNAKDDTYFVRLVRSGQWVDLRVSLSGTGSGTLTSDPPGINCGNDCFASYAPGTEVTLTAIPAAGSHLTGWSQTNCGAANTCTLRLNSAQTLSVTFESEPIITYPIQTSVSPSASGSLSCTPNPVSPGGTSTCTATPNSGYTFVNWSGDCSGTSSSCSISNVTSAQRVTAHFGFAGQPVATHAAPERYVPGGLLSVSNHASFPDGVGALSLIWNPQLPTGWSVVAVDGDGSPELDVSTGEISFLGRLQRPLDLDFSYQVSVPSDARYPKTITALARYRDASMGDFASLNVAPAILNLEQQPVEPHSADHEEPSWRIDTTELSDLLLYWREQAYHVDSTRPDGYDAGPGDTNGDRHSADYQDPAWRIDSFEANRVIGYWRAQAYHVNPDSDDGYAPGAQQTVNALMVEAFDAKTLQAQATDAQALDAQAADAQTLAAQAIAVRPTGRMAPANAEVPQVTQQASASIYSPGGTLTLTHTIGQSGDSPPVALLWAPRLPAGWTILPDSVSGQGAPELSASSEEILFLASTLPQPLSFSYQVQIPATASGAQTIAATLSYQRLGMSNPAQVAPAALSLNSDGIPIGDCHGSAFRITAPVTTGQQVYSSEVSLEVADSVQVSPGAELQLRAPRIHFAPGFRVETGGRLGATASAVTCSVSSAVARARAAVLPTAVSASGELIEDQLSAPPLITPPHLLPLWLKDRLSQLGIDTDPSTLISTLLDADEHWMILETTQPLLAHDGNQGASDLYRLDLLSDQLALISVTEQGKAGNGSSRYPAADASGELILFESEADDLVPHDTNGVSDIYLHDLALGQTLRLTNALGASAHPGIDAQGREIVYDQHSDAERRAVLITATGSGEAATSLSLATAPDGRPVDAHHPAISANGRFVVYLEVQEQGQGEQEDQRCQVHLYDRQTAVYQRQPCPDALAAAPEQARPVFSLAGDQLQWLLPGQTHALTLSNPLHPGAP
ncbi:MAG: hypothetical protein C1943_01660 [Halochromatium sp.]|nr:hypothetical protein [Halochromatium sp.]